ncbi:uncharacterized protein LOC141856228 [Brevipalpus obovatus]|uniref:uncharacterized protein LOC141856228 n=1 Tax=Brevipalpus obovatus TaxID=246614 RepID=UPI003D9E7200
MFVQQIFLISSLLICAHDSRPLSSIFGLRIKSKDRSVETASLDQKPSLFKSWKPISPRDPLVVKNTYFAVSEINHRFDGPLRIPVTIQSAAVNDKVNIAVDFILGYTICKREDKYSPEKCPLNKSRPPKLCTDVIIRNRPGGSPPQKVTQFNNCK